MVRLGTFFVRREKMVRHEKMVRLGTLFVRLKACFVRAEFLVILAQKRSTEKGRQNGRKGARKRAKRAGKKAKICNWLQKI